MPKLSSPALSVPPCLSPESAPVWARLRNYVRLTQRRTLLVIRHDSPRLPRELPPLLAEESGRPLVTATVSDAEPDPMAAALKAAPGGTFPAGCILTITGAEDLALKSADGSRAALFEFARRLDFRRDQFLPAGGIVLVWAIPRVFDALAEHSLNFISRAAAVLTLVSEENIVSTTTTTPPPGYPPSYEAIRGRYHLPPLPINAPEELRTALDAFEELAVANELYQQGGPKVAHALAQFDTARERIEAGWETTRRLAALEQVSKAGGIDADPVRDFARALLATYPTAGTSVLLLRQHPRQHIAWLEAQRDAARLTGNRLDEGAALGNLGIAYGDLGERHKAIGLHEQVLQIAHDLGDRHAEGTALMHLGLAHSALGDAGKALEFLEQAEKVFASIGDMFLRGAVLGNLGNAHAASGDARKAIEFYSEALRVSHSLGNRYVEGTTLGNLGTAYRRLGDARKAIEFHERYLAIAREIGDRRGEGNALWNSAVAHDSLGNRPEALARAEAALRIYESIESPNAAQVRATLTEWRSQ